VIRTVHTTIGVGLLAGLGTAALAAAVALAIVAGGRRPAQPPAAAEVPVVEAARPLGAGTLLTPQDLLVARRAAADAQGTLGDPAGVVGRTLALPLAEGAAVRPADLAPVAAAVPGPGEVAVTVPQSGASGLYGWVAPGQRVDVLATVTGAHGTETGVVASGAQVLATHGGSSAGGSPDALLLGVSPAAATRIVEAEQLGVLHLVAAPAAAGDLPLPPATLQDVEGRFVAASASPPPWRILFETVPPQVARAHGFGPGSPGPVAEALPAGGLPGARPWVVETAPAESGVPLRLGMTADLPGASAGPVGLTVTATDGPAGGVVDVAAHLVGRTRDGTPVPYVKALASALPSTGLVVGNLLNAEDAAFLLRSGALAAVPVFRGLPLRRIAQRQAALVVVILP
jgi:pilus assembly protein CpaB